jgi:hypothetical protein
MVKWPLLRVQSFGVTGALYRDERLIAVWLADAVCPAVTSLLCPGAVAAFADRGLTPMLSAPSGTINKGRRNFFIDLPPFHLRLFADTVKALNYLYEYLLSNDLNECPRFVPISVEMYKTLSNSGVSRHTNV